MRKEIYCRPQGTWVHWVTGSVVFRCTHPMCWRVGTSCTDRSASAGSTPTETPGLAVDQARRRSRSALGGVSLGSSLGPGLDRCCCGGPRSILCPLENPDKARQVLLSTQSYICMQTGMTYRWLSEHSAVNKMLLQDTRAKITPRMPDVGWKARCALL